MERRRDPGDLAEARSTCIPGVPPTCPVLTPGLGGAGARLSRGTCELNAAASATVGFINATRP